MEACLRPEVYPHSYGKRVAKLPPIEPLSFNHTPRLTSECKGADREEN